MDSTQHLKKEWTLDIPSNLDESQNNDAKLKNAIQIEVQTVWFHSYKTVGNANVRGQNIVSGCLR